MIDGTYQIVMKTLMGRKYGTLFLYEKENVLFGHMDVLGHSNEVRGELLTDGNCRFTGELITPLRTIKIWAEGRIDEKTVDVLVQSDKHSMPVYGEITIY